MTDQYLGEIRNFGFSHVPKGWAECDGKLLSIEEYSVLYSLLGTAFGGDGRSTFALPDLRGRVSISQGLTNDPIYYSVGQDGGVEHIFLSKNEMPGHSHSILASVMEADTVDPAGGALANARSNLYASPAAKPPLDAELKTGSISTTGNSTGIENRQPFLVTNFCIALVGIFPSRS